ncbi:MAG: hypothetical protein QXS54_10555 [Candidatus Methanomethylicaceae archaeon]
MIGVIKNLKEHRFRLLKAQHEHITREISKQQVRKTVWTASTGARARAHAAEQANIL